MALELLLGRKQRPPQFVDGANSLLLLELDAAIAEDHSYSNQVATYPVEDGPDITDHIKQDPERITIEGFISNAPVKFLSALRIDPILGPNRAVGAYEVLLSIAGYRMIEAKSLSNGKNSRKGNTTELSKPIIIDLYTKMRVFTDMVMEKLTIPRASDTGDALRFRADFVRVRKVSLQSATISYTNEKKYGSGGANDQTPETDDRGKTPAAVAPPNNNTMLTNIIAGGKKGIKDAAAWISPPIPAPTP